MTAAPAFSLPFPRDNELAHAYFSEAARHLQDARILHAASRYAGAITSTMKAVELGLKSLLILHGVRGWHDLNTHRIMGVAKTISVFDSLLDALKSQHPTLISDVEEIERLVPDKQSLGKLKFEDAQNTEYPFFATESETPRHYRLYLPETSFDEPTSERYFLTAHRLLSSIQALSPEANAWQIALSSPL